MLQSLCGYALWDSRECEKVSHVITISQLCSRENSHLLYGKWWSTDCKHPHNFQYVVIEYEGVSVSSLNTAV